MGVSHRIIGTAGNQKGAGRFPFMVLLALTVAVIYLMIVFIPIYIGTRQMQEVTTEIVRRGALQNLTETDIKAQLLEKARQFDLPDNRQIQLWREGRKLTARITYSHAVRFPFYTYNWPVEIRAQDLGF